MWQGNPEISIIIPVFNEEENISPLYESLIGPMEGMGRSWEIIFVDDGSKDGTLSVLRAVCARDGRIRVIRLRRNFGQTAALSAGFDNAGGQIVITMDGDLQNDPSDIPLLIQKLEEGYDIVSGWRKGRHDPFLSKRLPSLISNRIAAWMTGVSIHDGGCTLKAYRKNVLNEIHLYGELHRFIPAMAGAFGADVTEIEVKHHPRKKGKSKYGVGRIIRGFLDLIALKFLLSYMTRQMQIFGRRGPGYEGIHGL
jgi:glycosyltransferase involved in cell wall biosynthesis